MFKIFKYVIYDVLKGRMVTAFALFLMAITSGMILIGDDASKTIISLLNVILLITPLVSVITASVHYYNSREFIEVILAQPVPRRSVFYGEYFGISAGLVLAFTAGIGIPLLIWGSGIQGVFLILTGALLTMVFTAIAFLCSVFAADKSRGIGLSLITWFFYAVIFDAVLLLILYYFNDYPLEKTMLILTTLSPVDMARISIMLQTDTAALMGYTGAVYNQYLGIGGGMVTCTVVLFCWVLIPLFIAGSKFDKRDF